MQSIVRWLGSALSEPRDDTLRQRLRLVLIAWLFGSTWLMTISGAAMTKFARSIGMPDKYFGVLAALPYIMCLTQIPAAWVTHFIGGRKNAFLWFVVGGRLMWVLAAAVPWVLPNTPAAWPPLVLLFISLAWAGNQAATPAWIEWMGDIIPKRLRGRYFAVRQRLGQFMGLAVVMIVGYALDMTQTAMDQPGGDPKLMLKVTSSVLMIAALLGMLDGLAFQRLRDPVPQTAERKFNFVGNTKIVLKDKNFRRFLWFQFFITLGVGYIGQYIWLYVFDIVHFDNKQANLALIIVPSAIYALACPFWGRLTDRIGRKPVLIMGLTVGAFGAVPWIFIGHGLMPVELWGATRSLVSLVAYIGVIVCMFFWPAVDIGATNMLFSFSERREAGPDTGLGGIYVAILYVAIAIGGTLSGLIGSVTSGLLEKWHWIVPGTKGHMVISYHCLLFALALLLRLIALSFVFRIKEPRAMATREAFWFTTNNMYSNARDLVATPGRMFDRVVGWTYRMNPRRRGKP